MIKVDKYLFKFLFATLLFHSILLCGISVIPKQIYFDGTKKMIPITVRNLGDGEIEVSVRIVYSYITTNDTGKLDIFVDSASAEATSAAQWIKPYPLRFVLGGQEIQTIRIVASPPPELKDGEYWARIIIKETPRRQIQTAAQQNTFRGGMAIANEVGLPIYYRNGKVFTGLDARDFSISKNNDDVLYNVVLQRTGNAAFNGMQTIRIKDKDNKVVKSNSKNIVVFNTYVLRDKIKITDLLPGKYSAEVEILTKRRDVVAKNLIPATPVRFLSNFEIP